MLEFLNPLRDVTTVSVLVRLFFAVLCGGAIGIEREHKRRTAGFRTHILICLGAAMTTMISQFLLYNMHLYTDIGRLGAQVIAGIGFIGAGTIIVTKRRQVKGLTTAAGLWTCAIIGLAIGAGYFEAALLSTIIILLAEIFFSRFEYWVLENAKNINIYVEYTGNENLDSVIRLLKSYRIVIIDLEITKSGVNSCAIFQLQLPKKVSHDKIMTSISASEGIISVEEL
ncbi:MAG: MgtC/SapB family protein [Clostridiaceae bacterium]|nr:MgtC/SapB family protein [Clostridiaceae bacterium]MDY5934891.1 MgtC/SapB family protein [Oscillospiraceae bacterium]